MIDFPPGVPTPPYPVPTPEDPYLDNGLTDWLAEHAAARERELLEREGKRRRK